MRILVVEDQADLCGMLRTTRGPTAVVGHQEAWAPPRRQGRSTSYLTDLLQRRTLLPCACPEQLQQKDVGSEYLVDHLLAERKQRRKRGEGEPLAAATAACAWVASRQSCREQKD